MVINGINVNTLDIDSIVQMHFPVIWWYGHSDYYIVQILALQLLYENW